MRNDKRRTIKRPQVRILTVQPKLRINLYSKNEVPEIKLCGEWLHKLGFKHYHYVTVTCMPNLVILQPKDRPEEPPEED